MDKHTTKFDQDKHNGRVYIWRSTTLSPQLQHLSCKPGCAPPSPLHQCIIPFKHWYFVITGLLGHDKIGQAGSIRAPNPLPKLQPKEVTHPLWKKKAAGTNREPATCSHSRKQQNWTYWTSQVASLHPVISACGVKDSLFQLTNPKTWMLKLVLIF